MLMIVKHFILTELASPFAANLIVLIDQYSPSGMPGMTYKCG